MGRKNYTLVKRLLSPQLAEEVQCLALLLCLVPHVGCPFLSREAVTQPQEVGVRNFQQGRAKEDPGGRRGGGGGRKGKVLVAVPELPYTA